VLNGLKKNLEENTFFVDDLQKAHKLVYHREMVYIVSMVKHAAKESEPFAKPGGESKLSHAKKNFQ